MPRLLGVEIPGNKKLAYALRYVYGIGLTRALEVVKTTKLDPDKRARDLNEEELNKITEAITHSGYKIEGDLRREIIGNIKRLQAIRCYRGLRHLRGLPVRGQRTQTNARTRKGARKTVGVVTKK
ncbi:MAG: 30S ribosomal protein S13 [Puniceicoccales bacterium]|jgi:small subunit ribosomal protein S13|nr:30S ribosomal protein S13 [Puniceicoccales bacterium]